MMRSIKGQSALEYAALITVLAGVVAFFVWGSQAGSINSKVKDTYTAATGKIDSAKKWIDNTMK